MPHTTEHRSDQEILKYLNHDLYIDDMLAVERHLDGCSECKNRAASLESRCNKAQRDQFFEEETERIRAMQATNKAKTHFAWPIAIVIVTVVAIGAGWGMYNSELFKANPQPISDLAIPDTISTVSKDSIVVADSATFMEDTFDDDVLDPVTEELKPIQQEKAKDLPPAQKQEDEQTSNPVLEQKKPIAKETAPPTSQLIKDSVTAKPVEHIEEIAASVKKVGTITVVAFSDKQAVPANGYAALNQYIKQNFAYPETALNNGVAGEVDLTFSLSADNQISNIQLNNSLSAACDQLSKTILQNGPNWQPYVGDDFVQYRSARIKVVFKITP